MWKAGKNQLNHTYPFKGFSKTIKNSVMHCAFLSLLHRTFFLLWSNSWMIIRAQNNLERSMNWYVGTTKILFMFWIIQFLPQKIPRNTFMDRYICLVKLLSCHYKKKKHQIFSEINGKEEETKRLRNILNSCRMKSISTRTKYEKLRFMKVFLCFKPTKQSLKKKGFCCFLLLMLIFISSSTQKQVSENHYVLGVEPLIVGWILKGQTIEKTVREKFMLTSF